MTYALDKAASSANRWNLPKGPKARYIYTRASDDEFQEVLELDEDGTGFKPYVSNRFLKVDRMENP